MNRKFKIRLSCLGFLGCLILILLVSACSREKISEKEKSSKQADFLDFKSDLINVTFQYPSDWEMKEIDNPRANYHQIHLVGPRRDDIIFPVSLTVTTFSRSKSLDEELAQYLSQKKKLKDFNLLNRSEDSLNDKAFKNVEFSYNISLPLYAVKAKEVKIKERTAFLKNDDTLYKISFFVDEERFDDFIEVFNKVKQTFSLAG